VVSIKTASRLEFFILMIFLAHFSHAASYNHGVEWFEKDEGTYHNTTLTTIAFGSCNKQYEDQMHWKVVQNLNPDLWLWTGDIVYVQGEGTTKNMLKSFQMQENNQYYKNFSRSGILIEGTWDDHDYGVNDAGSSLPNKEQRRDILLDFLNVPASSLRRQRSGVYSSHTYGEYPKQVKVILLDVRTFRDEYYFPSPGVSNVPLLSILGVAARVLTVKLGFGKKHRGDILGEEQWKWLEKQLKYSQASIHIVVSGIQVLTTMTGIESWGHFPESKRRLFDLFEKHQPSGLLLVSGDVHFAEFLKVTTKHKPAVQVSVPLAEVTSSGLTHSVDSVWYGTVAKSHIKKYSHHRLSPETLFVGRNFGTIQIDWDKTAKDKSNCYQKAQGGASFQVQIRNIHGEVVLESARQTCEAFPYEKFIHHTNLYDTCNSFGFFSSLMCLFAWIGYDRWQRNRKSLKCGHD